MSQVRFNCTMQEGVIGEDVRARLAEGLVAVTGTVLGTDAADTSVDFEDIPHSYGFRGGELSTTSLVRGSIEGGVEQPVRVELMMAISDMWMEISGCTVDDLVVSARDV